MNDREELLAKLNAGRGDLLGAVEGMTNEQAALRPADGGWTPLEILEHVATVETLLLRRLQTQSSDIAEELGREREPELYARISTRSHKIQAPELVHPKGRFTTVGDAVGAFLDARERTLQWLARCDFDLRRRAVEHLQPDVAHSQRLRRKYTICAAVVTMMRLHDHQ